MVNPGYIYLFLLTRATGMLHKHKLTLAKAKLLVLWWISHHGFDQVLTKLFIYQKLNYLVTVKQVEKS